MVEHPAHEPGGAPAHQEPVPDQQGNAVVAAFAKSRTWRGLTTTTGMPAVARATTSGSSNPPVASKRTTAGVTARNWSTTFAIPSSSLGAVKCPSGRSAMSNWAWETSIPTNTGALILTSFWVARPCMMRAQWPTQLFGLCRFGA